MKRLDSKKYERKKAIKKIHSISDSYLIDHAYRYLVPYLLTYNKQGKRLISQPS